VRLVKQQQQPENGKDVEPGQREWGGGDGSALSASQEQEDVPVRNSCSARVNVCVKRKDSLT
jgi:hypothetical protein